MNTTLRTLALALAATLALSGCLKMDVNLELQSDDTVNGSMIFAVQEGLGEMLGEVEGGEAPSDEEAAREIWGEELAQEFENASEEPYNQDGWVGTRVVFSGEPLDAFTDESDGFTITRDGDEFVVQGPFQPGPGEEEGMEELYEGAEMTLSVTFPGTVNDHNGTLDGTTVSWDMLDPPAELFARGDAAGGVGVPLLVLVGILVAVIVIAAALTFVVIRARGGSNAGGAPTDVAAESASTSDLAADAQAPEDHKDS